MGDKGLDFKHKEVVNITNGKRLGFVQDVCADLETGMILKGTVRNVIDFGAFETPNDQKVK